MSLLFLRTVSSDLNSPWSVCRKLAKEIMVDQSAIFIKVRLAAITEIWVLRARPSFDI
jgi:hypothetical protein